MKANCNSKAESMADEFNISSALGDLTMTRVQRPPQPFPASGHTPLSLFEGCELHSRITANSSCFLLSFFPSFQFQAHFV